MSMYLGYSSILSHPIQSSALFVPLSPFSRTNSCYVLYSHPFFSFYFLLSSNLYFGSSSAVNSIVFTTKSIFSLLLLYRRGFNRFGVIHVCHANQMTSIISERYFNVNVDCSLPLVPRFLLQFPGASTWIYQCYSHDGIHTSLGVID